MNVSVRLRWAACAAALAASAQLATGATAAPRAKLEVYFLLDATASMQRADAAVRDAVGDMVTRLKKRVDLRHGYGVFRDTSLTSDPTLAVYERMAPIGQGGSFPVIRYAGGGDHPEGHTFGLYGTLGEEHLPWLRDPAPAGFTGSGRKLVVLVSDAPVGEGGFRPTMRETLNRLDAAGIAVAGLSVVNEIESGRPDLEELASETRATARRAADCDGDRRTDLRPGAPLVCEVYPKQPLGSFAGFADALVARFG